MKNILCYGDSNTWGFVPGSINFETLYMKRYPRHERWTGILQTLLGDDYYIIEEGLNGRTTNVNSIEVPEPNRNGKMYLPPCLYSHAPLDLVIIMLGMNDLKKEFNRSSQDIAAGLSELIEIISQSKYGPGMQSAPKVLLIGYPLPTDETGFPDNMFAGAIKRAKNFSHDFATIAAKHHCAFIDAAPHIQISKVDGIHFDEIAHRNFAHLLQVEIMKILKD